MIDHLLRDALGVLSCPFWSNVLRCGSRLLITHLQLLDRAVSGARFLTGGVFECDIAHRRSVEVLRMLYKIRCNPMHSLLSLLQLEIYQWYKSATYHIKLREEFEQSDFNFFA